MASVRACTPIIPLYRTPYSMILYDCRKKSYSDKNNSKRERERDGQGRPERLYHQYRKERWPYSKSKWFAPENADGCASAGGKREPSVRELSILVLKYGQYWRFPVFPSVPCPALWHFPPPDTFASPAICTSRYNGSITVVCSTLFPPGASTARFRNRIRKVSLLQFASFFHRSVPSTMYWLWREHVLTAVYKKGVRIYNSMCIRIISYVRAPVCCCPLYYMYDNLRISYLCTLPVVPMTPGHSYVYTNKRCYLPTYIYVFVRLNNNDNSWKGELNVLCDATSDPGMIYRLQYRQYQCTSTLRYDARLRFVIRGERWLGSLKCVYI